MTLICVLLAIFCSVVVESFLQSFNSLDRNTSTKPYINNTGTKTKQKNQSEARGLCVCLLTSCVLFYSPDPQCLSDTNDMSKHHVEECRRTWGKSVKANFVTALFSFVLIPCHLATTLRRAWHKPTKLNVHHIS